MLIKKIEFSQLLGYVCIAYWLISSYNSIFLMNKPLWLLWYSSLGLFLTGIALVTRSNILLTSMFCALFIIESIWSIGFLSILFFKVSIFGIASYVFEPTYSKKDFYISLYHLLIPIALFIGVIKERPIHKIYSWIGASTYAGLLAVLTYFLADKRDSLNCVHTINNCLGFTFFTDMINSPFFIVGIFCLLTVFIFIPSDYFLSLFHNRLFSSTKLRLRQ